MRSFGRRRKEEGGPPGEGVGHATVKRHRADIGVLGAGIMGSCLALELAQRGYGVDLIDLAAVPMTGASLHNEGKLHLGFVYAKDPLKATHQVMLRGSLAFARILEKLTGCREEALMASRPFHYYVPLDSQVDLAGIEKHFQDVETVIHEETRASGDRYLGRRIGLFHERNGLDDHRRRFSPERTLGSFRTEERSVSTVAVAGLLRQAIAEEPAIEYVGNMEVLAADRLPGGDVEVECRQSGDVMRSRYSSVANCLGEDRLRVDETAGIGDQGEWIFRYRALIRASGPTSALEEIPSATGVLGAYGDVVNQGNGWYYLSWYPLCKLAQSTNGRARGLHDAIHKWALARFLRKTRLRLPALARCVAAAGHRTFIRDNIREMAAYIPALGTLLNGKMRSELGGGIIVARGATDIDDPDSYLHQRSVIGPVAHGSYLTIDTGKYCTAPLFAVEAAEMIERGT